MKKSIFLIFLSLLVTTFSFSQNFTFNQGGTNQTNYYSVIPYENVNGKIIVEATINGKKHKFILDTGAPNIISSSLFNELHPSILFKKSLRDANGVRDSMTVVETDSINFGGIYFKKIPTLVTTNDWITKCSNVDGFIGSNMLRNSIVRFSSADKTIILTDNKERLSLPEKESSELFLVENQSSPFIWIKLKNGKHKGNEQVEFDSGDDALYEFTLRHYALFKKYKIFNVITQTQGNHGAGLFGLGRDTTTYKLTLSEMNIGNAVLQNPVFETTTDINSRMGTKLLDYGIVTIDYMNKKFYFEPFTETTNVYEKQLGISPTLKNNKLVVGIVWDENLKDSIHAGDEIISVDGKHFDENNFCNLITSSPFKNKDSVTLKIKDASGRINEFILTKK